MKLALGRYEDAVARRVADLVATGAADRIWRRDPSFWSPDPATQSGVAQRLGWLDAPSGMGERVRELEAFSALLPPAGLDQAVVLGIGGSSLAPEVLATCIGSRALALHVLDTTDPATIRGLASRMNPARTLFFVSSKSGTTVEPLALFDYFHGLVGEQTGGRAGANFIATTDPGTPLEQLAREREFRATFTNAADVGGRYSALTYFGMAPAAVAGIDIARLLARGGEAAAAARQPDSDALRLGAALGELALQGRDKVTFIASPAVASFGLWVEQLIAESTGKQGRGIVPVVGERPGTPARYGGDRVFVQLRLEGAATGEDDAFVGACIAAGHPVVVVELDTPYDLGRLFFEWEFAIAVAGHVLGVNPFDEPNVQEAKDITAALLRDIEATGALNDPAPGRDGFTTLDAGGTAAPVETLATLLAELRDGSYFAINAFVPQTRAADAAFADLRAVVRDGCHVATTLGYGPRYLHSTGQLHKGGPPSGVFLVVTCEARDDAPIPGRPYTFGQLQRAQAIGDVGALGAHGLAVARVHITGDVEAGLRELVDAARSAVAPPSGVRR
jgi:glucose-6-phosphate isomerase